MNIRAAATAEERSQLRTLLLDLADPDDLKWDRRRFIGAWHGGQLVAAAMWQREADGSAFLFLPGVLPECPEPTTETTAALLITAAQDARSSGCRFAIAFADPENSLAEQALSIAQFPRLTDSLCLSRTAEGADWSETQSPGAVIEYREEIQEQFHETFEESLIGSQDCVGLRGLRSVEETFAMFAAAGKSVPGDWILLEQQSRPVALLLMNESPHASGLEISYLGVVPRSRGAGLGRALVAAALRRARTRNFSRVFTAVDVANIAARRLYEKLGFVQQSRFHIFLKQFPS